MAPLSAALLAPVYFAVISSLSSSHQDRTEPLSIYPLKVFTLELDDRVGVATFSLNIASGKAMVPLDPEGLDSCMDPHATKTGSA